MTRCKNPMAGSRVALVLCLVAFLPPGRILEVKGAQIASGDPVTFLVGRKQCRVCLQGIDARERVNPTQERQDAPSPPWSPASRFGSTCGRIPAHGTSTGLAIDLHHLARWSAPLDFSHRRHTGSAVPCLGSLDLFQMLANPAECSRRCHREVRSGTSEGREGGS